ncbi:MAG TPA: hypothetical protein VF688_01865 [Allosphingosinicella sp.]
MMYLAGWTERNTLLKKFGISASIVPEPIQNTLARGYLPLLAGLTFVAFVIGVPLLLDRWLSRFIKRFGDAVPPHIRDYRSSPIRHYLLAAIAALLVGYVSGLVSGEVKEDRARRNVIENDCQTCFVYRTPQQDHVGRVLAQNETITVLLTKKAVIVLKTPDITAVWTYSPRSK